MHINLAVSLKMCVDVVFETHNPPPHFGLKVRAHISPATGRTITTLAVGEKLEHTAHAVGDSRWDQTNKHVQFTVHDDSSRRVFRHEWGDPFPLLSVPSVPSSPC